MSLQGYYDNYARVPSRWAHPDPARCGCHGSGWWVSELDTMHECPYHHITVNGRTPPHPEDEGAWEGFNHAAHRLECQRGAYAYYRDEAMRAAEALGEEMDAARFRRLAQAELPGGYSADHKGVTPAQWVEAARAVEEVYQADAERQAREDADAQARASGYSCDLERRWAEEAASEARWGF